MIANDEVEAMNDELEMTEAERGNRLEAMVDRMSGKIVDLRMALIILLKSRDCFVNHKPEIAEEISAQFDIGLAEARLIIAALESEYR